MNYESRLLKLEHAIGPQPEPMNVLHVIIDPAGSGDRITEAIAIGQDRSLTHFAREPGESKDTLCERAERAMGWVG